ncbi:hypothetical protein HDV00_007758 [Rhizophlyctis rosea]|nr:hypothetical protein HDV00_007758 [Rhizophlyctis rosea]
MPQKRSTNPSDAADAADLRDSNSSSTDVGDSSAGASMQRMREVDAVEGVSRQDVLGGSAGKMGDEIGDEERSKGRKKMRHNVEISAPSQSTPKPSKRGQKAFTDAKSLLVGQLVDKHGTRWKVVTEEFNKVVGKTESQICSHWHHVVEPRRKKAGEAS